MNVKLVNIYASRIALIHREVTCAVAIKAIRKLVIIARILMSVPMILAFVLNQDVVSIPWAASDAFAREDSNWIHLVFSVLMLMNVWMIQNVQRVARISSEVIVAVVLTDMSCILIIISV